MKRVILHHTYGPLSGLDQIVGLWPDLPVPDGMQDNSGAWAMLMDVGPHHIRYRSAPPPEGQGADLETPA